MTQHATSTAILLFSDILEENKFAHFTLVQFYQMKGHTSVFESSVQLIQKYVALLDAGCGLLLLFPTVLYRYCFPFSVQHKS